ncbi:formylglycine-generating enzyme family protein [Flavobacterium sp.]|uniref:formylglycine-generating enzyme family protein n=1 Tax=Flavobacterium sp. TaxID=239 RepID=UPI00260C883F|nr:formylglycine-generating enzyme family protein [Flavobacterium sp.]MDD2985321.1 formylglycine-generating enzyme family protein [Flavobacterium sp.]
MYRIRFLLVILLIVSCENNEGQNAAVTSPISNITISKEADSSFSVTTEMALVKGGSYVPLYGQKQEEVIVNDLYMDVHPVTNAEFLDFVKKNEKWQKSKVKKLFADGNYLVKWQNDTLLNVDAKPNSPVTNVSWYAANAYCDCQGKRLATVDEWEYAAMADETIPDARKLESYNQIILDWYEKPKTYQKEVGTTFKNYYGVYDLHGLVWEWTSDFNSVLITGESRGDSAENNNLFCGSGSLNATDLMNYAAFIRYAFRGSVKANYSVQNLGFRCVKDIEK